MRPSRSSRSASKAASISSARAARLVDVEDAPLEVDAAPERAQDLVRGAEDAVEERELLRQQVVEPRVGGVLPVEEVQHQHVALLAVAVAAADALLDPLRVPRQVVVDHQVAELEVEPLGAGLGHEQDLRSGRGTRPPAPAARSALPASPERQVTV